MTFETSDYWWPFFRKQYRLGIIGPDASGKTALYNLLTTGKLNHNIGKSSNKSTSEKIRIKYFRSSSKKSSLFIRELIDSPGDIEFVLDKEDTIEDVNVLVFVVRSNLFNSIYSKPVDSKNHIDAAKIILLLIKNIIQEYRGKRKINKLLFIGNHYSKLIYPGENISVNAVPEVPNFIDNTISFNYNESFFSELRSSMNEEIRGIQRSAQKDMRIESIAGSFSVPDYANSLVESLCKNLNGDN